LCLVLSELARADGCTSVTAHGRDGITGGQGGAVTEVKTLESLIRHVANSEPTILAVQGTIKAEPTTQVRVASNKTICGSEADAELVGIEMHLVNVSNVIIKNLTIRDSFVASTRAAKPRTSTVLKLTPSTTSGSIATDVARASDGLIDLRKSCDCVTVSSTFNGVQDLGSKLSVERP